MDNILDVDINFVDTNSDSYLLKSTTFNLGRQFTNNSTRLNITIPKKEENNVCVMYVFSKEENILLDLYFIEDNKSVLITRHLSKETLIKIQFKFFNPQSNYVKFSDTRIFTFLKNIEVNEDEFVSPEEKPNFLNLYLSAFTQVELNKRTNELIFSNIRSKELKRILLPKGEGGEIVMTDHAELDNLEFEKSKHIGFASTKELQIITEDLIQIKKNINKLVTETQLKVVTDEMDEIKINIGNLVSNTDLKTAIRQSIFDFWESEVSGI